MAKLTRFQRSQNAHARLWTKHHHSDKEQSRKLLNYHAECFNNQKRKGEVLTKSERRIIFKDCMRWG